MKKRYKPLTNKQKGATLITALMMLLVMTILGISAIKMSSISILIAGNDQQKLMLMQETETALINLATPAKLLDPLIGEVVDGQEAGFDAQTGRYDVRDPQTSLAAESITDMSTINDCQGFGGKAVSLGPDVPPCRLYDFQVRARTAHSGARETRRRGAGKEVPNIGKNSYLSRQAIGGAQAIPGG